jgi:hypothetical protein
LAIALGSPSIISRAKLIFFISYRSHALIEPVPGTPPWPSLDLLVEGAGMGSRTIQVYHFYSVRRQMANKKACDFVFRFQRLNLVSAETRHPRQKRASIPR